MAENGIDQSALLRLQRTGRSAEDTARGLAGELTQAIRAVRHNPLRRKDRQPLTELTGVAALAGELAGGTQLFVDELADLSTRDDLRPLWPTLSPAMIAVVEPLAVAMRAALATPDQHREGERIEALSAADAAFARWRTDDQRPISAVVRRPLHRLLNVLHGLNVTA